MNDPGLGERGAQSDDPVIAVSHILPPSAVSMMTGNHLPGEVSNKRRHESNNRKFTTIIGGKIHVVTPISSLLTIQIVHARRDLVSQFRIKSNRIHNLLQLIKANDDRRKNDDLQHIFPTTAQQQFYYEPCRCANQTHRQACGLLEIKR